MVIVKEREFQLSLRRVLIVVGRVLIVVDHCEGLGVKFPRSTVSLIGIKPHFQVCESAIHVSPWELAHLPPGDRKNFFSIFLRWTRSPSSHMKTPRSITNLCPNRMTIGRRVSNRTRRFDRQRILRCCPARTVPS